MAEVKRQGSADNKKAGGGDEEGGANNAPAAEQIPLDPRVEWFSERVLGTLRFKSEKWKKMTMTKENVDAVLQFIDQVDVQTLLFYVNAKEDIVAATKFTESLKRLSVFFMKNPAVAGPVTQPIEQCTVFGELPPSPLEYLGLLLEEVYSPMLGNPKNLEDWPQVVANDLATHFHTLQNAVYVISGQAKV